MTGTTSKVDNVICILRSASNLKMKSTRLHYNQHSNRDLCHNIHVSIFNTIFQTQQS